MTQKLLMQRSNAEPEAASQPAQARDRRNFRVTLFAIVAGIIIGLAATFLMKLIQGSSRL